MSVAVRRVEALEDRFDVLEGDVVRTRAKALQLVGNIRGALKARPASDLDFIEGDSDALPIEKLLRLAETQQYRLQRVAKLADELEAQLRAFHPDPFEQEAQS